MARPGEYGVKRRWCIGPGSGSRSVAASAVNANGAFWFCTYDGALNAELFIALLQQMMKYRRRPVHLVLDSLPAHKKAIVRDYVAATDGKLTLHFLPGYAPDLNPDELVWSHVKRTGTARRPLQAGEKLREKIEEQLARLQQMPRLVRIPDVQRTDRAALNERSTPMLKTAWLSLDHLVRAAVGYPLCCPGLLFRRSIPALEPGA